MTDEQGSIGELEEVRAKIAALQLQEALLWADFNRLQQLYDKAPLGYQSLDENGCFLAVNQAWLDILGYREEEVIGRNFADFLHPEWQGHFQESFPRFKDKGEIREVEFEMRCKDGRIITVAFDGKIGRDQDGRFQQTHCIFRDITARRAEEAKREAERRLLRICHLAVDTRELVKALVAFFQELTHCEAVGIRLRHGEDYPYYESRGFPSHFLRTENFLCERSPEGTIVRDGFGNPVLECMCGSILHGRFDQAMPFFTERGSFWTNSTSDLLAETSDSDRQSRTRNRCNGEGYESVALIPFRLREKTYGLLQFNDPARGRFTPQLIGQLEDLAAYVSLSLSKHMADSFRRETEEKYRLLVERAHEAIIISADQRALLVNPAAERLAGYSAAEIYSKTFTDLVHPDDLTLVIDRHRRRIGGEEMPEIYSFRIISGDGKVKWVEVNGSLIQWQGEPAALNFITDITARKQAEEALYASEKRYRALFEHSPVATWEEDFSEVKHRIDHLRASGITNLRGFLQDNVEELMALAEMVRVVDINQRSIEVLGASSKDEVSRNLRSYFTDESLKVFADELVALASGMNRFEAEIPVVDVHGRPITLALKLSVDPDDLSNWSRVLASFVDISERKRNERQLREQAMILDQISDAVTVTDLDGIITYVNQASAGKFGRSADELAGRSVNIFADDPEHGASQQQIVETTLARGSWQGEVVNYTPNGQRMLMDCRINTFLDPDGKRIGMCGISTDITERRRTENLLQARLRMNETAGFTVERIMQLAIDEAEKLTGSRMGCLYALESDQETPSLCVWSTATKRNFSQAEEKVLAFDIQQTGILVDALRQRQPVIHNGSGNLPGIDKVSAGQAAIERALIVPVVRGGTVSAIFGLGNKPFEYDRRDAELVSSLADMVWDIVLRNHAEEALKASEERFRSIYAISPAGIAVVDPVTLRFLRANRSFLEIVGYTEEELLKLKVGDLTHPDDWAEEQRRILDYKANPNGIYTVEKRYIHKDGGVRWVQLMADYLQRGDAKRLMIANVIDITERVRAEEINRLDEARLESLLKITQYSTENIQELLDFVLDEAIRLTGSKIAYIYFYDEDQQKFTLSSWSKDVMQQCRVVKPQTVYHLQHTGLWGEAVRQRRPIVDNDYRSQSPLKKGTPEGHIQLSRFLTVPIFSEERIVAVAAVANKDRDYDKQDVRQLILMMDSVWKVVQQRRTEAEREDNIRRLRLATDSAKLGVWDWDIVGDRMLWDDRMYEMYGIEPVASPTVAIWTESLHPDDRERMTAEVKASLTGEKNFDTVFRIIRRGGDIRHIKADGLVVRDRQGQALRMLGVNRDITDQCRAEEALRTSEEQHRLLVQMLPDIICHFDRRRRNTYASDNISRFFDLRPENMTGRTVDELGFPEDLCRELNAGIGRVLATGEASEMESVTDMRSGQSILNWRLMPQLNKDGQVLSVLAMGRDITDYRRAERDYRQLFDSMLSGFALHEIIVDAGGIPTDYRFLAVNPAFEQMTGLGADQVVGRTVLELLPETERYWVETYGRVALTGEPITFENYHALLGKHFMVSAFQPSFRRFACIFRDITERIEAEQERQKLEAQLRQAQKLEAVGTLAGGIAHDFNNILTAILGYAELAREDSLPGSLVVRDVDQILVAGKRARDLVKQILAFSRQSEIELIPLQPSIIVKEAMKLLRSSFPSTIRIVEDIDGSAGLVLADPTQIHQVLVNLCTNAYHAMEKQGGVLTITLQRRTLNHAELHGNPKALPGEYIQLAVRDTGPGISPEIHERIFDPYFTTKEHGKGTGLGLAIVRGIVMSCGGVITCRSTLGEGSEFCVSLPAHDREEKAPASQATHEATVGRGEEHILFVDDEEILVMMGRKMLQRMGYKVTGLTDSRAALELFRQHPGHFDLMITDQTMPEMTGIELARAILQIRPKMPIILCTGYSNIVSEESALATGISAFAFKPLVKQEIASLIRTVLEAPSGTSEIFTP